MEKTMKVRNAKTISVGDMIRSPRFEFGRRDSSNTGPINVGGTTRCKCASTETRPAKLKGGRTVQVEVPADPFKFDGSDATRPAAVFVVEQVQTKGGSQQAGYPDGQHVIARRLHPNKTYNVAGEQIAFYMSGCFMDMIEEVELCGLMEQRFVRVASD
jgi:hypothetical protein